MFQNSIIAYPLQRRANDPDTGLAGSHGTCFEFPNMTKPTLVVCCGPPYTRIELKHNACVKRGLRHLCTSNCVREVNSAWNKPAKHKINCSVATCLILPHELGVRTLYHHESSFPTSGRDDKSNLDALPPVQPIYRKRFRDKFNHASDWFKLQLVMMLCGGW